MLGGMLLRSQYSGLIVTDPRLGFGAAPARTMTSESDHQNVRPCQTEPRLRSPTPTTISRPKNALSQCRIRLSAPSPHHSTWNWLWRYPGAGRIANAGIV